MSFRDENIYNLLPAIYRIRDIEHGSVEYDEEKKKDVIKGPLKAFIEIIAEQAGITEDNIAELYDNWFIETCKEWVVPYIGDLLGVKGLNPIGEGTGISQRAYVANTLSYRRRKGTAPVLEQLALDISGWRAHVVEFFEFLQTSQYMNHVRLYRPLTPDLRRMDELDRISSAFDTVPHSADVRHISSGRGKYNIPNIGIFTWRLQSYPLTLCDAQISQCTTGSPPSLNIFTFNPTGKNTQLFNRPKTEASITHISTEINVPGLLRRRALFDELEAIRQALTDGTARAYNFFDKKSGMSDAEQQQPVFEIFSNDSDNPVPPEEILICNLEECCTPPPTKEYKKINEDGTVTTETKNITVAADPVTGRFIFSDQAINKARVNFSYGFSGDVGGGPYNRQDSITENFQTENIWQVGVSKTITGENIFNKISDAINEWNLQPGGAVGIISIMDNGTYPDNLDIMIKEKSKLLLIAAGWPLREGAVTRDEGDIIASNLRPFISGNIKITGTGDIDISQDDCGEITINGLLIGRKVSVTEGQLGAFNLIHSTIIPEKGGLDVGTLNMKKPFNQWLNIYLNRSICGKINLFDTAAVLVRAKDSIIDRDQADGFSFNAADTPAQLSNVTIFGKTEVKEIEAENCIFNDTVITKRQQAGCIRFSFVPPKNSKTPRLYRCQPDLEIADQIAEAAEKKGSDISDAEKNKIRKEVRGWLIPFFTSLEYNHYAYGQLGKSCPLQISNGADNASEMGAFNYLRQPQREANLRIALDEYLPLGLEAGIIHVT
jgi:hypothetical protein